MFFNFLRINMIMTFCRCEEERRICMVSRLISRHHADYIGLALFLLIFSNKNIKIKTLCVWLFLSQSGLIYNKVFL